MPENMPAGEYPLTVKLVYSETIGGEEHESQEMNLTLTVAGAALPAQKLIHTEWFHCDCLAQEYRLKPWSEEFWQILENYFHNFVAHGINLLLTPLFTLPMDTAQGKERLTTQLIGIKKCGSDYQFDFTRLKRWIDLARKCGIHLFEFSHLFSQGGAKYPTKIVADVDGEEQIIFGWAKPANDPEFKRFLDIFLPLMVEKVKEWGLSDQVYFHVGDEPNDKVLDTFTYAARIMQEHLKGFRLLDAASHVEFYEQGLLDIPVPIDMCLKNFLKFPLRERWTYYCGGPDLPYSNRLHTMPASANRIMGTLLYWYQCDGFLHWGYNFWNSGSSLRPVNPLGAEPDFDYHPGDQFLVYPGKDGHPIDSMHYEVFYHGLQDLRAYQKLESLAGREKVLDLIRETAGYDLEMNRFPLEEDFLFRLRARVNQEIQKLLPVS